MNKTWIKILVFAIITAMALPLFACTGDGETESTSSKTDVTSAETSAETSEATTTDGKVETEDSEESMITDGESIESIESIESGATEEIESSDAVVSTDTDVSESESSFTTETDSETDKESTTDVPVVKETEEGETTEEIVETTEKKEEVTVVEKVYGYDFKDSTWSSEFDMGASVTREIAIDPAGSGEAVLAITHSASQSASWIRNKNAFENTKTGKFTLSVDLYIPSDAFADASGYVQIMINGDPNHHGDLVSDAKGSTNAFETKDFPRDKWFKVQFIFDMDKLTYDLVVVEDGQIRTEIFTGRGAKSLAETGPINMRIFVGGAGHTVYIDHVGVVTTVTGEIDQGPEIVSGVSFLRLDGINAAGNKLSVYGDFAGDATSGSLTNITWEKSSTYSGTYSAISGVNGLDYTPSSGGYYLRVKAKYGTKTLTSYPVYIRDEADASFFNPYLSLDDDALTSAIVYNNEGEAFNASVRVVVYDGDRVLDTYTDSFTVRQGSDLVTLTFNSPNASGKRVELTVTAGNDTLCKTELAEDMPLAKLQKTSNGSSIYIGKEMIADFSQNRYMRFRSTTENDHWIGTEHNPIDMGFAYQETGVAGLFNTAVDFTALPGAFRIVFTGQKAGLKTEQTNELIGFWNAEKEEFSYIYNCSMTADTVTWHNNSSWAASGRIEPFDYHLERMSILDRVYNDNQNGDLYDYVIYENGDELVRIPKLPVPRTAINGTYFYGFFLSPGESVYYPDPVEGGWKSTILSDSGDTYVEICWSWYDMHSCSENSVPRVGNCDEFTVSQSWLFTTTTADHDADLINGADEVEWRDLPNYQLPLFSTDNTFETQFGGTDWQYAWWKSSYDCTMDATVGHDGAGSVKIEKTTSGEASWYTEGVWGFPYSFDDVRGKTYRVSGYIKTENVVGEAYIANIQYQHATPADNTVIKSEVITGTTDWTYVTFTFTAQQRKKADNTTQNCIDHFFLTLNGTGTVWFDDVVIEVVE